LFDTENAPNLGYTWGIWEQNVIEVIQPWFFLSFAYKWQGSKAIRCISLPDFPGYQNAKINDLHLVKELWRVMDEADVVIAHNGDRFDIRKANARFAKYRLGPPSPYKTVDTLKMARRHFQFDSNKLDELGHYLGVGRKLPHTGKHLWFGCMAGDPKSWAIMRRYNCQDVALLERIYLHLRAWSASHPKMNHISRQSHCCPTCLSPNVQYRGHLFTRTGKRQRMHCMDCGTWSANGPLIRVA
jgi:hypothetical protein